MSRKCQSNCSHYIEEHGESLDCPHNSKIKTEEYCDVGIEMMKRHEIKVEEGQRDKFLHDLRCSKCGGDRLELKFERNLHTGYIRCNDCGNFDTREFIDGKPGDLVKCDLCGSSKIE